MFQFASLIFFWVFSEVLTYLYLFFKERTNFYRPSAKPCKNIISSCARQLVPADSIAFIYDKA